MSEPYFKTKIIVQYKKPRELFESGLSEPFASYADAHKSIADYMRSMEHRHINWTSLQIYEFNSTDNPDFIVAHNLDDDLLHCAMDVSYGGMDGIWLFRQPEDFLDGAGTHYKTGQCVAFDNSDICLITMSPGLLEDNDPTRWENVYLIHSVYNGYLSHDHAHESEILAVTEPPNAVLSDLADYLKKHPDGYRSEEFVSIVHKQGLKMEGE